MPVNCCIQPKPFVVTIIGAAGAGKSQLAKATVTELGEHRASRVPTDYFLVPRGDDQSLESFVARPLRYDWALLRAIFHLPVGTQTTTPDVDFEQFTRRDTGNGLRLTVRPVMICDAMAPYPEANLVVRLDVPDEVRLARIAERDIRWGTRVQDRWQHLETTWHEVADATVDLVMDGREPLATNARRLAAIILDAVALPT